MSVIFRLLNTAILAALLFLVGVIAFAALESAPDTQELDTDVAAIQRMLAPVKTEADKYEGGALKTILELQLRTLEATLAMLNQKRTSVLRRIVLDYRIDGKSLRPAEKTRLDNIQAEIAQAEQRAAAAESEASRYSGGLIQTMALVTASTERTSISFLRLKYVTEKYGLGIDLPTSSPSSTPAKVSPGKVVKDKDAL
jgi:uncharacterized protein YicC (UPF0701 family)